MDNYAAIKQAEFIYVLLRSISFYHVLLRNLFLKRFPGLHLLRVYCGLIKNHLAHNGRGDYLFEEHTCFDSFNLDVIKKVIECRNCVISGTWIPKNPALFCSSALKKSISLPVPGSYIVKSQSPVTYSKHVVMET